MKKEFNFTVEEERLVGEKLDKLIPKTLKGYEYLKTAILITIKNNKLEIDKVICPNIAKIYGISEVGAKVALKRTIQVSFDKNEEEFRKFFGEDKYRNCQSISRFIKRFVEIYYLS